MSEYKQVILVRRDLKMGKGKIASQCSHASVEATLISDPNKVNVWRNEGMKKIVLRVETLEELLDYQKKAKSLKLITALIKDAAKTQLKQPEITCLAIGPDKEELINSITKHLSML